MKFEALREIEKMAYIEIRDLKKSFSLKDGGNIEVLKGINLDIDRGDIYGIVGFSGAGKSTLVRCLNRLEEPDSGSVTVNGENVVEYPLDKLLQFRSETGMIFQQFNLLKAKNVYENIALPLKYRGTPRQDIKSRVAELLQIVGLEDKVQAFPSQLSGGQKQRVAIARALAANPKIILSDEATSALDPQTTDSILKLLKQLNRDFGITIILITHQMNVIQQICNKVAVIDDGLITEQGTTFDVFAHPKAEITKRFVSGIFQTPTAEEVKNLKARAKDAVLLHLIFTGEKAGDSCIAGIIKDHGVDVNILYGSIEYIQGDPIGSLYVAVDSGRKEVEASIEQLEKQGVEVSQLILEGGELHESVHSRTVP